MCNAFLWNGAPNSARGAKISWEIVCTSKESHLVTFYCDWVRRNLIRNWNFWDLNPASTGSWIWRRLCKLRPLAKSFIVCVVGSGETASFWYDNWTGLGPLLDLTGPNAPQIVGLPLHAVMLQCQHDDTYLWKTNQSPPSDMFSTSKTWLALNPPGNRVPWHKSVWFKHRIPKHAFICWVAAWNRLHTRDRLRNWGLNVPALCPLCDTHPESRDHLFFQCEYSASIWTFFTIRARVSPPTQFMPCLLWIHSASSNGNLATILKLAFQASIYHIWKERNQQIHSAQSKPATVIIKEIQTLIRARLLPLSIYTLHQTQNQTLLITWFSLFL
ncbi:PREDICTED: uncharacterized protein LOC109126437 [Camelina sativa]|uniref:Uncharacterized protein LOC109126437 n=1 Tax=Camelina sativa TaxID=90675 RepID=A0ABM1QFI1_CAMSA|nr:PREDICTED: uncharacterized protein LOC109126437 [Camelina sativa]